MLEFIGYIAGILGATSLVPEIAKALKTHHLKDVAWGMLILSGFSSFMWTLYGIHIDAYPIIFSDGIHFATAIFLIYLKIRYSKFKAPLLAKENVEEEKEIE